MRTALPLSLTVAHVSLAAGPICKKSLVTMSAGEVRRLDAYIRMNPMPAEYQGWTATILCNDCLKHSEAPWHFAYHKARACRCDPALV